MTGKYANQWPGEQSLNADTQMLANAIGCGRRAMSGNVAGGCLEGPKARERPNEYS